MPMKKKLERQIVEGPAKVATPEEIEAAKEQAKKNAGEVPVVESPVKVEESVVVEPKKVVSTQVVFKSMDMKKIQLTIGKEYFEGTTITVPKELADEAERILTEGHYLITRIN